MDWALIVELLVASIGGGVITKLVTLHETKKGMKLDNKGKDIENRVKQDERWSALCDELQEQLKDANDRLDKKDALLIEKDDIITNLRDKLDATSSALIKASVLKCNKMSCVDRKPPLGYSELTTEELINAKHVEE